MEQGVEVMRAYLLWTVSGPQIILTSCDMEKEPDCLTKYGRETDQESNKYIAFELPWETIKARYGEAFDLTMKDFHQTDKLRVLDIEGERVLLNIHFSELGQPIYYEPESAKAEPPASTRA